MLVKNFIEGFKEKKIMNSKLNEHAVSDYLKETLEIKTYLPFKEKRAIAEMIVDMNTTEENGILVNDNINQYVSFITAMLGSHTALEFSEDPVLDYDLLAESGLLPIIIEEFKVDYNECDILLKMALAAKLENNNINVITGKFLNGILDRLDSVGEVLKNSIGDIDLKEILGVNFNEEDLAKLSSFLNKYNK